ncbi:heterokaryon incompatibility protein-domain-containing protein [Suillus paluster]|uniref:heterokaryon incompatibility protein-domain-containing protein n=1 Tax=Suillus paluster TaxID=48578 RepID=UPI001B877134|nr:heterokaryon incompatibility protein-domain-containing protein [Suillus paluster]KAG1749636.1 heterokaryon incompatibility protein-domain-containing protein [Suillus paluster]
METSTQFRYQPLSTSSSIRLLRIRKFVSILEYDLIEADLENNPVYDALSYTWQLDKHSSTTSGIDSERGGSISCNGMNLNVTANLLYGLLRLERLRQDTLIWIDAICINQQDLEERGAQVNMMGRIFGSARTVVVWLGEPSSDPGVQSVEEIVRFMEQLPYIREEQFESVLDYKDAAIAALREMTIVTHTSDWLSLGDFFFTISWFQRCWIIQEVVLARTIEVYHGPTQIPWDVVQNAARLLDVVRRQHSFWQVWREKGAIVLGSIPIILLAREHCNRGKLWPLETNLALSRTYQVTDPRDKIFALFAISDRSSLESPVVELDVFSADYTKSIDQVYMECSARLVEGRTGYAVLSMVEDRSYSAPRPIPSWVPDFSVLPSPPPLAIHGQCPFSAGGFTSPLSTRPTVSPDWKELCIPVAVRLGRISRTSETGQEMYSLERMTHFFRLLADPALRLAKLATPAAAEALWRTLISDLADPARERRPAPAALGASFAQWVTYLILRALDTASHASVHAADHFPDGESPPGPIPIGDSPLRDFIWSAAHATALRSAPPEYRYSEVHAAVNDFIAVWDGAIPLRELLDATRVAVAAGDKAPLKVTHNFVRTFLWMCSARRVFSTERGDLGISHQSARVGDEVVVLPGAAVPFVVREVEGGAYILIGEAFVHGAMGGEALERRGLLYLEDLRLV